MEDEDEDKFEMEEAVEPIESDDAWLSRKKEEWF